LIALTLQIGTSAQISIHVLDSAKRVEFNKIMETCQTLTLTSNYGLQPTIISHLDSSLKAIRQLVALAAVGNNLTFEVIIDKNQTYLIQGNKKFEFYSPKLAAYYSNTRIFNQNDCSVEIKSRLFPNNKVGTIPKNGNFDLSIPNNKSSLIDLLNQCFELIWVDSDCNEPRLAPKFVNRGGVIVIE
jgi:hypothetical protein